jgi:predicted dehydrogenase
MGRSVAEGLGTYPGLPELLAHPDLDAVWLVTPTSLHADQVIASINAGKHVFCEKPLALDPTDCDRAVAAAANHPSQVAMVGFMRRFDPAYTEAKRRIDAGQLGRVFAIRCVSEDPVDPDGFFVRFAPTSGGIFLDCCIHDIDLVRWMFDGAEASSVTAAGSRIVHPALGECGDVDTGSAAVAFKGGQIATFNVSRTSHRGYEASMTIVGAKGALDVGGTIPRLPMALETGGAARSPVKSTSSNVLARRSCAKPTPSQGPFAAAVRRRSASKTRGRRRDWPAPCAQRSGSADALWSAEPYGPAHRCAGRLFRRPRRAEAGRAASVRLRRRQHRVADDGRQVPVGFDE